ncbi:MAG: rod shape-determining protein MreC, partial [Paracoccaceae bacterium]
VQPSGQNALVSGDNTLNPSVEFLKDPSLARPGDRVVTSGRGGTLPPDLLIGQLVLDPNKRLRVKLAADYERLKFVRVLRDQSGEIIDGAGALLLPEQTNPTASETTMPVVD